MTWNLPSASSERFIGNTVLADIHYRLRTEIPQIVQRYFKTTDNAGSLDYVFSQLFQELVFVEGKVSSTTYADLQTYQFLDNPQHVALELRGECQKTKWPRSWLQNPKRRPWRMWRSLVTEFLVPYRGMAICMWLVPEMDYRRVISLVNVIGRALVMKLTDYRYYA